MDRKAEGIVSGVLGSLALVMNWIVPDDGFATLVLFAMSEVAFVTGLIARNGESKGWALAGIITGGIMLLMFAVGFIRGAAMVVLAVA